MKAKKCCAAAAFGIVVLGCWLAQGASTNELKDEVAPYIRHVVTATNGLKLGILPRTQTIRVEDEIWLFLSLSPPHQRVGYVYAPQDEYLARFELLDTNNVPVPKTVLGNKYKLAPLPPWSREVLQTDPRSHGRRYDWPLSYQWHMFLRFPPPAKLFRIEAPGTYRLWMNFQVYEKQRTNRIVVRFPPIEVPVIRSD